MVEQNFQPQVRDTTDGPNLHTYIPRADGAIMVGGVAYYPGTAAQASGAKAPTVAVVAPVPASLPFMLQPGQTAATMQMQTPVCYPYPYFPYYPASASARQIFSNISTTCETLTDLSEF
ncbi:hypothetical protein G7Y89_g9183 [Cudoniella acicularis]|uniref:Uncharacterized protein n=1 Tax=Cudoniella acicularis TaxID=354080 RepID=A0A8H4W253_9HELO|nr:hypothetical protein G7Y89_g9183 [Cudoniella acicularis]